MKTKGQKRVMNTLKRCLKKGHLDFLISQIGNYRYEKKIARFYSQFLTDGDVYYDIGANRGNRIAPVLKYIRNCKIVASASSRMCIVVEEKI
jgi:hypothetical protein